MEVWWWTLAVINRGVVTLRLNPSLILYIERYYVPWISSGISHCKHSSVSSFLYPSNAERHFKSPWFGSARIWTPWVRIPQPVTQEVSHQLSMTSLRKYVPVSYLCEYRWTTMILSHHLGYITWYRTYQLHLTTMLTGVPHSGAIAMRWASLILLYQNGVELCIYIYIYMAISIDSNSITVKKLRITDTNVIMCACLIKR